ncbi:tRNA modification GTPase TrmE [Luminiphilus syltensis NOR5-1B]|uniref:tRNA modification GTPase MnmE n=1 Tax=Luminiphilus syltensis NOR5-1B TaxID=565045 RepID=B8KUE2_9GAMM|nr:tRNA uridine-5-carboxymethylaminomethyl(34) synthesis GTPase MnmE [Luminiphilus syltensis]EED34955.1 tRNA modification GTPase TrmE [Luminiphilus syltensis NOR5-1B]
MAGLVLDKDTIAAIATPPGRGGVGIIRLSGPRALPIAEAICGGPLAPRTAHFRSFSDQQNDAIDNGIALSFPAPHSFTGEDVVELQGHGGPVIQSLLLERCLELGARMARPGEFSERAFLNDKIDLVQAEAIADLIDAQTRSAAKQAKASLSGRFSDQLTALAGTILDLRKYVEAAIDFPDEDIDFLAEGKVAGQLTALANNAKELLAGARRGAIVRAGAQVVLAGKPNAGKSSLMNRLAGDAVAIVTDVPGTTRDLLRQPIELGGVALHLTDTAGLRDSEDTVEQEGVKRARSAIEMADVILHVIDDTQTDSAPSNSTETIDGKTLLVYNKIDLSGRKPGHIEGESTAAVAISTKTGAGMASFEEVLLGILGVSTDTEDPFSARERHIRILETVNNSLATALEQFLLSGAGELLAEDLRLTHDQLGEITGRVTTEDLLGEIFSNFCIGK